MHKYRNALFIIVSLLDVVYGEMSERDCERYPGPLGGAQRDSEKYGARKCGASLERQESMRAGRQGDSVVPNVERARDIRVSHPQRTTRRIGNKVKDIKSFTTIRQSLFRGPSLPRFAQILVRRGRCLPSWQSKSRERRKLLSKGRNIILASVPRAIYVFRYITVHRVLFYIAAPWNRTISMYENAAKTSDGRMKTDCWICTPRHQIKRIRNSLFILYGTLKSRRACQLFPKYTIKLADNFLNAARFRFGSRSTSRLFDRYIVRHSVHPSIMAAIITPAVNGSIIPSRQIRRADRFETSRSTVRSHRHALIKSSRAISFSLLLYLVNASALASVNNSF